MSNSRRILIHFLGKGHSPAVYLYGTERITTPYILEALTQIYKPDEILLYGTLESVWEDMFRHFLGKTSLEHQAGGLSDTLVAALMDGFDKLKSASNAELEALSDRLSRSFQALAGTPAFASASYIHVQLLHYGDEEDGNKRNYQLLTEGLQQRMQGGSADAYEVAFDITHSFRSFPFFNYSVLEYLRCLLPAEVSISHIFYGAFENKDKDECTPVEDMIMVEQVNALTHAVEEFKNTGRCKALAALLSDEEKDLRDAIQAFDDAIQTNNFDEMDEAVVGILNATVSYRSEGARTPYTDARQLMGRVLQEKLFGSFDEHLKSGRQWTGAGKTKRRLMLARMLCGMENHGQASLIATQAFKDLLLDVCRGLPGWPADSKDEAKAENRIIRRISDAKDPKGCSVPTKLRDMAATYLTIRSFRDTYAHNFGDEEKDPVALDAVRKKLPTFLIRISELDDVLNGGSVNGLDKASITVLVQTLWDRFSDR